MFVTSRKCKTMEDVLLIHFSPYTLPNGMSFMEAKDVDLLGDISSKTVTNTVGVTEKQARLVSSILSRYLPHFSTLYPDVHDTVLQNKWAKPFRVIQSLRSVAISEGRIVVKFPYDKELISEIKELNVSLKFELAGSWDHTGNAWTFPLVVENILPICNMFKPRGFHFSSDIQKMYEECLHIVDNVEAFLPMVIKDGETFTAANVHERYQNNRFSEVKEALFHFKRDGISDWSDDVDVLVADMPTITQEFLRNSDQSMFINSNSVGIPEFKDIAKFGGTTLVVVPDDKCFESLKGWVEFFSECGIDHTQMSVLFRVPNEQAVVNVYIRDNNLGNPLSSTTKAIFVMNKIPKPFLTSKVKVHNVINLKPLTHACHYTLSWFMRSTQNIINYYPDAKDNAKKPSSSYYYFN